MHEERRQYAKGTNGRNTGGYVMNHKTTRMCETIRNNKRWELLNEVIGCRVKASMWNAVQEFQWVPEDPEVCGSTQRCTVMTHNPDHSHNSECTWPNCANSELWTSNTKLRNVTPNRIAIHSHPDLSIGISLLHPYISHCLIVLVDLALAYVPWLLYPSLYCPALVPFQMYFAMTLPSHLMFCLALKSPHVM